MMSPPNDTAARSAARCRGAGRQDGQTGGRGVDWSRPAQILALLILSALGAELLLAYDESTGDPAAVAFAALFFAGLYGAPALLAREFVRRLGWGWPSLLLIFAALGVTQACLIDQSLFAENYRGYQGWEDGRALFWIPALGFSASQAFSFIGGHLLYSFAAPVAVAEAWVPRRARTPWLGPVGIVLATVGYLATAAMIISDPSSRSGSVGQLATAGAVVGALLVAAVVSGPVRLPESARHGRRPPVGVVLMITVVAAGVATLVSDSERGLIISLLLYGAVGVLVLAARGPGWSVRHVAAIGLGLLLTRGLLAFSYFPLLGEVQPWAKYTHNTVLLVLVIAAGVVALRPGPGHRADIRTGPSQLSEV